MSSCLSEARIQAVADGEATAAETQHVERCMSCRGRVEAARQAIHAFADAMSSTTVPAELRAAIADAVHAPRSTGPHGATRLLPMHRPTWVPPIWLSAAAALILAALGIFVVAPSFDRSSTLSAAEILDRSIATLTPAGTELLEYELVLTAAPGSMIESGTYRIEQVIEHRGAGRWRLSRFDASGHLLNGMSEDPTASRRRAVVRLDGQPYAFEFATRPGAELRLGEIQRQYAETAIRMIQVATGQAVSTEEDSNGRRFVIEVPAGRTSSPQENRALPWELTAARVVVDAKDYHVIGLTARGLSMGRRIHVSYRLLRREVRPSAEVAPSEFELPIEPMAVEIHAEGTSQPPRDIMTALLREVARLRR